MLIELEDNTNVQLERILEASLSPFPESYLGRIGTATPDARTASEHGAHALFTGAGGDALFYEFRRWWPAADHLRLNGFDRSFLSSAMDAARLGKLSVWKTLALALREHLHPIAAREDHGRRLSLINPSALPDPTVREPGALFRRSSCSDICTTACRSAEKPPKFNKTTGFAPCRARLVFCDLTTIRAEGHSQQDDDVRHFGMSKEGVIARQFMLGAVQTADVLPIYHEVFDGNTAEAPTLEPTPKKVLVRYPHIRRLVVVADRGLLSLDNIEALAKLHVAGDRPLEFILAVPGRRYGEFVDLLAPMRAHSAQASKEVVGGEKLLTGGSFLQGELGADKAALAQGRSRAVAVRSGMHGRACSMI